MSPASLSMVRVALNGERLFEFARRRGLPVHELDVGYAVHCALRELFGDVAPQPFAVEGERGDRKQRWWPVLGYATADAASLREHAQLQADPWLHQHLVDWNSLASKTMPSTWRVGQALSFTVRACPVVRTASEHAHHAKGKEVDVYLVRCRERPEEERPAREEVYRRWLADHFERHPGASLREVQVESFQLDRMARKVHAEDRRRTIKGRPDVTFTGTLEVTDPAAFDALLRRGVGRHRAFGFGMLLLRPARVG